MRRYHIKATWCRQQEIYGFFKIAETSEQRPRSIQHVNKGPMLLMTQSLSVLDFSPPYSAHCNEIPIYVFFFWELRGLSPNFYIHVSVSYLYIP